MNIPELTPDYILARLNEIRALDGHMESQLWLANLERKLCKIYENMPMSIRDDGYYIPLNTNADRIYHLYHFVADLHWMLREE